MLNDALVLFFYSSLSESWGCIDLELKDRKPCSLFCSPPNECDVLLNVHFKLNDGSLIALRDRQDKCFCPFLLTVPAFKCPEKTVIVVACCSFSVIHPKLFFPYPYLVTAFICQCVCVSENSLSCQLDLLAGRSHSGGCDCGL